MTVQRVRLSVSPDPSLKVRQASAVPHQALVESAPGAVLGSARVPTLVTAGVHPDASTCFGPRGAALLGDKGPFWISDTGHHRLLGWKTLPGHDLDSADYLIGQSNFESEGRNGKGAVSAFSVNVPTGICACAGGMVVADAWNHRILIWHAIPADNNVPADIVLGQADFSSNAANKGCDEACENSMYWPYGVAWLDGRLLVADSGNNRVSLWELAV